MSESEQESTPQDDVAKLPNEGRPYITIAIKADQTIGVFGTIQDKVIAYGLLGAARDAIQTHIDEQNKVRIAKPEHRILNFLRSGKKLNGSN